MMWHETESNRDIREMQMKVLGGYGKRFSSMFFAVLCNENSIVTFRDAEVPLRRYKSLLKIDRNHPFETVPELF